MHDIIFYSLRSVILLYRRKSVIHPLQIYCNINCDSNLPKGLSYKTRQCNYKINIKMFNLVKKIIATYVVKEEFLYHILKCTTKLWK